MTNIQFDKLTAMHGIYKDGIEYCSECNGMLTKIYDDFDERLWCEACKASTIKVDYSQDERAMTARRNQWLAKYPAFAYYASMPKGHKPYENTHGQGVTDYDSFKASECEALLDRR